ncbi:hypothetical protein [Nonomuraea sp. GTA35]|uniref:hypothetical protein n=1 Tax=Nonomuraea sp. GTA35 TaxID=1676746 RepID=UPI0035C1E2B3
MAAAVLLAGVAVMWLLGIKVAQEGGTVVESGGVLRRRYAVVVAAEVVLFLGGHTLLGDAGSPDRGAAAWAASVAGVHFLVLVAVWREGGPAIPGVILILIGVAGLAVADAPVPEWVPGLVGPLAGVTILGGCAASSWRTLTSMREPGLRSLRSGGDGPARRSGGGPVDGS